MTHILLSVLGLFLLAFIGGSSAAECNSTGISAHSNDTCPCPDVFLDAPNLSVNQIYLAVDKLEAHVSLNAKVANLVQLTAGMLLIIMDGILIYAIGVDVSINKVELNITGVRAQLQLVVRLENVRKIVDRALNVIQTNPEILTGLLTTVEGLLTSTVNSIGQTVQRLVTATGDIISRVVDSAGNVVSQQKLGNVLTMGLQLLSTNANPQGQTVKVFQDTTGALLEIILSATGSVLSAKVLQGGTL